MNRYNLIIIVDKEEKKVLMCKKMKKDLEGRMYFVGGRIEQGETDLESAYRELFEETGIPEDGIKLYHMITYSFPIDEVDLVVYAGVLTMDPILVEEENPLMWVSLEDQFEDCLTFAGEGNVYHMINLVKIYMDIIAGRQ